MMTGKVKFWSQVVAVFAVALTVPAWLGANWMALGSAAVIWAIAVGVHIAKHGQTTKGLWRIRPNWWRSPSSTDVRIRMRP